MRRRGAGHWPGDGEATRSLLKSQRHVARVLMEKVGCGTRPDQNDFRDAGIVGSRDREVAAIWNLRRCRADRGARAFEKIRWREDFRVSLIGHLAKIEAHA